MDNIPRFLVIRIITYARGESLRFLRIKECSGKRCQVTPNPSRSSYDGVLLRKVCLACSESSSDIFYTHEKCYFCKHCHYYTFYDPILYKCYRQRLRNVYGLKFLKV